MSKYLTEDIFHQLKNRTTKTGFTFAKSIQLLAANTCSAEEKKTSAEKRKQIIGIVAGDVESYELFSPIMEPIINHIHNKKYHTAVVSSFHKPQKISYQIKCGKYFNIKTVKLLIRRNICGFLLSPSQTDIKEKLKIEQLMKTVFKHIQDDTFLKGKYYSLNNIGAKDYEHLFVDSITNIHYNLEYPKGRGIYVNHDQSLVILVNESDHLQVIYKINCEQMKEVDADSIFNCLKTAVHAIETVIKQLTDASDTFLHTKKYGFITCCPSNLGSSFRTSIVLSAPQLYSASSLSAHLNKLDKEYKKEKKKKQKKIFCCNKKNWFFFRP
eukprot:444989_1